MPNLSGLANLKRPSERRDSEDLSFRSQSYKSDIGAAERPFDAFQRLRFALNTSPPVALFSLREFILPERRDP